MEETFVISQLMTYKTVWWSQKSINRTSWWLYNRLFFRLCLFQRQLQTNCSWLKKTKSFRCWCESNSRNSISRSCWGRWWDKNKTIHYSQTIKRNCVTILQRNSKSFVISVSDWKQKANVKLSDTLMKKLKIEQERL